MKTKNHILKKLGDSPSQPETSEAATDTQSASALGKTSSSHPPNFKSSHLDLRNPATNRTPRGKVAHLPPAIREQVCEWIAEGITLEQITKSLADIGHPGFTHQNISKWKENGYHIWCENQKELERTWLRAQAVAEFAGDPAYTDRLLAVNELYLGNQLADTVLSRDPNADPETETRHAACVGVTARAYTSVVGQRIRGRRLTFDQNRYQQKQTVLAAQHAEAKSPPPKTDEALRQAVLDAVDTAVGIKSNRAQLSAPQAKPNIQLQSENTANPSIHGVGSRTAASSLPLSSSFGGEGRGEVASPARESTVVAAVVTPPSPELETRNTKLETPPMISAHLGAPPAQEDQSNSVPPAPALAHELDLALAHPSPSIPSPLIGRGLGEGDSFPQPPDELEPWEKLLLEPLTTPFSLPEPPPLPRPFAADAKPVKELPVPLPDTPYPPAPLLQPEGTLALCNYNGVVTAWVAKSEDPRKEKPWIEPIKNHKTGETICWFDFHSRPPGMTDADPVRGRPHFIPVFDATGRIINWAPEPEGKYKRPPTLTTIPLESDHPRTLFAWLEPGSLSRAATDGRIPSPWGRGPG